MYPQQKAIIIGAGVAGLATAIRLAVQGFNVHVFEKNKYAGGKIAAFAIGGFHFDEGPSLFTQPENISALFELAGKPIDEYFTFEQLPISCKYFYENGTIINAYADSVAFAGEISDNTGEPAEQVTDYLEQSEKVYNNIGKIFLNYSLHKKEVLKAPLRKAFATANSKLLFKTLNALNEEHFTKPEIVQLFNRFATYNGSNPYKAPGMLSLIPHLEQNQGTYYPKGGMISIAEALFKLAKKLGVVFHFNSPVERIINNGNKVEGVISGGTNQYADVVVSNMDVYFTYKHLLRDPSRAAKILKQERSSSAIIFYWGIKKQVPELELHNVFFSGNYKEEFDCLFNKKTLCNDPTVYINITSKMESVHAPPGKENWFVMVNAPANSGQDWNQLREQCRDAVIQKLSRILKVNVAEFIEVEQVMDPVIIEEKTSSYMGSLYGTSSNGKMAAFLRHPNFSSAIKNLYFVGGSVHPGGGIPLCLHGAKIVSDMIKHDREKHPKHSIH
jgi:phytoene desaturase